MSKRRTSWLIIDAEGTIQIEGETEREALLAMEGCSDHMDEKKYELYQRQAFIVRKNSQSKRRKWKVKG